MNQDHELVSKWNLDIPTKLVLLKTTNHLQAYSQITYKHTHE